MAAKKQENLLHLKFEYAQGVRAKRDLLNSEANFLKISQILSDYKQTRDLELKNKEIMGIKMSSLKKDIALLERLLPKLKIPKILKKPEIKKIEGPQKKEMTKYGTIEEQLKDIKEKLKSLEN